MQTLTSSARHNDTVSLCSTSNVQEKTQEDHSNKIRALNVDSLKVDSVVIQNPCSETEDNNSETASSKSVKESSLNSVTKDKQLEKDEFQEDGCMKAFWGVNNQFQEFIDSNVTLDYDNQMTEKYFIEYTGIESNIDMGKAVNDDLVVTESSGTESEVQDDNRRSWNDTDADDADIRPIYDKEPMAKVQLTIECNIFAIGQQHTKQPEIINEDHLQKQLDKDEFQEDGSMTTFWGVNNKFQKFIDSHVTLDYDSQMTEKYFVKYTRIEHTEQPEIINEGRVDQSPEQRQVKIPMFDSSLDSLTNDYSKQSLESENSLLKQTVAQFQKDFSKMEAHCIALELKYQNQALKSGQHGQVLNNESNKAKIKKQIDVLETINIELEYKVANFR
nr:hypothetical protein [Tanacetum cinerariifolium]